jgi:hypothetical protein
MLARIKKNVSYANVLSSIALFVALGGGAYALSVPSNSVGSKQLKKNAVTSKKIKSNAVTSSKIKSGAITSSKVKDSSLLAKDFKSGQLLPGPKGDKGDTGSQGPAGPGARWVLVQGSDGTVLATNDSSITVTRDAGGGFYFVNFGSSVLSKLILATLNRTGGSQTGEVVAGPCGGSGPGSNACAQSNNSSTVLVQTANSAGATTDRNFFLAVIP